jgi:hypothetical protein
VQPEDPARQELQRGFSPVVGGPFYRLLCRTGLVRAGSFNPIRPALASWVLTWGVMAGLNAIDVLDAARLDPLLTDYAAGARLWVAIPFFYAAEAALHDRVMRAVRRFERGAFVTGDGAARIAHELRRAERLRDSRAVELVLFMVVVLFTTATFMSPEVRPAFMRGPTGMDGSATQVWYALVGLPLFQFLLLRWLWRWAIWSRVIFGVARVPMRLVPTHPDLGGGLGMFAEPLVAFSLFAAGVSSSVAGTWSTQLVVLGTPLQTFGPMLIVLVAVLMLIGLGPLFAFWWPLMQARIAAMRDYGQLAIEHNRLFHLRWIERGPDNAVLGAQDISSLADLQSAHICTAQMRLVPFGKRAFVAVLAGALTPMVLLITLAIPTRELLIELVRKVLL